jgi:hypothetical protein
MGIRGSGPATVMKFTKNTKRWNIIGKRGFSGHNEKDVIQSMNLVTDTNGVPYVGYQDFIHQPLSAKASVMKLN